MLNNTILIENIDLIINSFPLPVFVQDIEGTYLACNDRFSIYLDLEKAEIIGKKLKDIIEDSDFTDHIIKINRELMLNAEKAEGQYSWSGHSITKTYKSFIVNKSLLRDSAGNIHGIIGTITDTRSIEFIDYELGHTKNIISKKGLDNDALKLLNHEFRTPMNIISGLTEILFNKEEDPIDKSYLQQIKISNERLLGLITNILQAAEIESDDFSLNYESINIGLLIENIISGFKSKAVEKNINLFFSEDNSIPDQIITSKFALTVIISNLISNAIKYSSNADVIILLRKLNDFGNSYTVELSVEDFGIGIPDGKKNIIFNKYTQINSDQDFNSGVGLGLNIVKQLIDSIGGEIEIESSVGKGSKFIVTFPVNNDFIV